MANLQNLLRSQELQKNKTTGINAPTSSNPVIKTNSPLNFAQPDKAQTALNTASARGAFDIKPVTTRSGQDTGFTQGLDDRENTQIYGTGNTVAPTTAQPRGVSEYDPQTTESQEANRRFFGELRNQDISQDELRALTGTDDVLKARAMIEGRAGLSSEDQYALNEAYEQLKFDKAKAKAEAELLTKEEQIRKDSEAQFAPQYTAAKQAGQRSQESALRIQGRAAMGSKSEQQQQDLIEYQRQVESSIAAEQRLQEQMLLAQARGASDEEIASLSDSLNAAKAKRQEYQEQQELVQAGLDEASIAKAEANNELAKTTLDALKSGYQYDPETGGFQKLQTTDGQGADIEQSMQFGFLVSVDGQPILNGAGNIVEMPKDPTGSNLQQVKRTNPITGETENIGYFDPTTGKQTLYADINDTTNVNNPAFKGYIFRDEKGSQCGEGINDNSEGELNGEPIHMGNTYESKVQWIDPNITPEEAQPGNTLVLPMTVGGALETGHVAFINDFDGEKFFVDEWNRNGDEQLTSGFYTLKELDDMAKATGQEWGIAPTRFAAHVNKSGSTVFTDRDSAIGGDGQELPQSDSAILKKAQQWGHDITNAEKRKNLLDNYHLFGIMPENENIKLMKQQTQGNETAIKAIDDLLEYDNLSSGVGAGALTSGIPMTPGYYVATQLDTILGAIAIKKLLDVKSSGGTFGALSEKELDLLKASMGALKQGLTATQFKKSLNNIRTNLINMNKAVYEDLGETYEPSIDTALTEGQTSSGIKFTITQE